MVAGREQRIAGVVAVLLLGEACGGAGLPDDHRVVDGREAVSFLVAVKDRLEAPDRLLLD